MWRYACVSRDTSVFSVLKMQVLVEFTLLPLHWQLKSVKSSFQSTKLLVSCLHDFQKSLRMFLDFRTFPVQATEYWTEY